MSFFPIAYAATETAAKTNQMNFMSFVPMIVIFVLFWFLLIRPQQKKAKLHSQMLNELKKGETVITTGGILGKIVNIEDQFIILEIANNVDITIQRNMISGKFEKNSVTNNK